MLRSRDTQRSFAAVSMRRAPPSTPAVPATLFWTCSSHSRRSCATPIRCSGFIRRGRRGAPTEAMTCRHFWNAPARAVWGDVRVGAHIHALKANLAANRYDVEGMRRNADAALNLVDDGEPYVRASIIRIQAAAHHFSGEFLDASVTYRGALSICDRTGDVLTAILAETGLGMVLEEMGQTEEAQIRFESVIERAGDPNQPITCEAHAGIGRLAGERGDVAAAVDQLRHARELARRIQGIDSHITAGFALCRVHIAAGDAERARHELARTAREIDSGAYEHYRDTVEQLESTISRLRSFPEQSEPGTRNHPAGGAGGSSPDALTRREREILGLIADGLSNDEIATRLFLSLSTVKGHNTRIFEKLRVHRRTEAVAEARRQGVL
jgi:ATP/maltotriose-dependent transcriptional regulator MalT